METYEFEEWPTLALNIMFVHHYKFCPTDKAMREAFQDTGGGVVKTPLHSGGNMSHKAVPKELVDAIPRCALSMWVRERMRLHV